MPKDEKEPPRPGRAPRSGRSFSGDLLLLASGVLPLLVFLGVAAYDRQRTLALTERDLLSTAETIAGHARNVFRFEALALGATEEWLRGVSDSEILASPQGFHNRLRALKRFAGEELGITVIGADGRPLVDSDRSAPPRTIDLSDRPYFLWHRNHPEITPYVAPPLRSRVSGERLLFLTLRRSGPGGEFAGVIAAAVRQQSLVDFWSRAASNPLDVVTLLRDDGLLLARRPTLDLDTPRWVEPGGTVGRAIAVGETGMFQGTSAVDGVDRFYVLRRVEGYPVLLVHGMPRAAVLAPWRDRLLIYGLLAGGAAAALLSLSGLSRRRTRELDRLNAGLERRVEERTAEIQAGEARLRLLAREVDHRAKNALSVVQAALRLTPRTDAASFAAAVEGRVLALARAHTLLADDQWRGASLQQLLRTELAPFVSRGEEGPAVELDGPPVLLPPVATQPLARPRTSWRSTRSSTGPWPCRGGGCRCPGRSWAGPRRWPSGCGCAGRSRAVRRWRGRRPGAASERACWNRWCAGSSAAPSPCAGSPAGCSVRSTCRSRPRRGGKWPGTPTRRERGPSTA